MNFSVPFTASELNEYGQSTKTVKQQVITSFTMSDWQVQSSYVYIASKDIIIIIIIIIESRVGTSTLIYNRLATKVFYRQIASSRMDKGDHEIA